MSILGWVVLGGIAGWIANALMGSERSSGCCMNVIIGVIGAVVGGAIFSLIGGQGVSGFNIYSLAVSVVGAVVVLGLANLLRRR